MPQERLPMRKIREVLRLKAGGFSKRRIAASLGISATAAMECVQRARRAGLAWPLPDGLDDVALELRLYPPPVAKDEQRPLPNWTEIHRELKRSGVTLQLLWQELVSLQLACRRRSPGRSGLRATPEAIGQSLARAGKFSICHPCRAGAHAVETPGQGYQW